MTCITLQSESDPVKVTGEISGLKDGLHGMLKEIKLRSTYFIKIFSRIPCP